MSGTVTVACTHHRHSRVDLICPVDKGHIMRPSHTWHVLQVSSSEVPTWETETGFTVRVHPLQEKSRKLILSSSAVRPPQYSNLFNAGEAYATRRTLHYHVCDMQQTPRAYTFEVARRQYFGGVFARRSLPRPSWNIPRYEIGRPKNINLKMEAKYSPKRRSDSKHTV
jgi:hypothetical protein